MSKMKMRQIRRIALATAALFAVCLFTFGQRSMRAVRAQTAISIQYGQTLNGQITASGSTNSQVYTFTAQANDVVSIVMKRTSGTLRPLAILADPSQTGQAAVLAQANIASDGKSATVSRFTIQQAGTYAVIATHDGLDAGTTAGKFSLTLSAVQSDAQPSPTVTPKAGKPIIGVGGQPTATSPADTLATPVSGGGDAQTFTVGTQPVYSVWNGNNLYVANAGDGTVSILDGDGNVTGTVSVGGSPFAMAWDGARLWVADLGTNTTPGNTVSLLDESGKKLATYKVGAQPISLSYDADNQRMWVALYGDNKVVALDPKGKITTSVDVSKAGNNPNTVLWDGTQLWVTLAGSSKTPDNKVLTIDATGHITGTYTVGSSPADLAWDDTNQTLYVANYLDDTVMALDANGKIQGTYPVGKNPSALAWDGKHLWVTLDTDKTVSALGADGTILATIPVPDAPNGIAFDGLSSMWVALQGTTDTPGSRVARIDITSSLP